MEVFCRKGVLKIFCKIHGKTPVLESLFFFEPQACNFIKKETLVQMFSCEFCEIFKNTFFHRTPLVAASMLLIVAYIRAIWRTYQPKPPQKSIKTHPKKILIFPEMELSSSNIKKILIFSQKKAFLILFSPSLKSKKIHPGKIYYTSGNKNSETETPKSFFYFRR